MELLYLSRAEVESLGVAMGDLIDAVEDAFREKGRGGVEMPPKPGVHPRQDSFLHAMPAYLSGIDVAGLKWVAGYPANPRRGLPYISGLVVLNDPGTGLPLAVMDASWITAFRTGAATGVTVRHLGRPGAEVAAILGLGVQGRTNLEAILAVCPGLRRVQGYDVNPEAADRYAREMTDRHGVRVTLAPDPEEAVRGADVVVTAGPILNNPAPVLRPEWLAEGVVGIALDFDSYWTGDALRAADLVASDDRDQLDYYRTVGFFTDTPPVRADLGDIVAGKVPGRTSPGQRIISINLGLAIEDLAAARLVYREAVARGRGTRLPL
ncbi:MAG: ornithine cyclodeaminase family protein [bacterium]|nr:ornithine cyclodeaminase family protein [bacterium]